MANLHEPIGQNVQKEPADELKDIQAHPLDLVVVGGITIGEGNPVSVKTNDSFVGEGNPMRMAAKIFHGLLGVLEGRLTVNHPLLAIELPQKSLEVALLSKGGDLTGKLDLP